VNRLSGKAALITGSSKGIGLAIAKALADAGCRVAINGRDKDRLEECSNTIKGSIALVGDVSIEANARQIVAEAVLAFGDIDILICNVGNGRSVKPGCEDYDEWQRMFALNLWSATNMIESATESLSFSGSGAIVCISSICGLEVVPGAPLAYSAAKSALNSYVKGVARTLAKKKIRINAVAPGNVTFPGSSWDIKLQENAKSVQDMLDKDVALACFGTPKDIAEVTVFLASERASFVTGSIWTVDGGQVKS
jgi:NAD(P)-dependent dehydrogenase (short-subunit alcohol dehydrogenase family)